MQDLVLFEGTSAQTRALVKANKQLHAASISPATADSTPTTSSTQPPVFLRSRHKFREIKQQNMKHQLFLVLDGVTSTLWGANQDEGTTPVTQDLFSVADMALFIPSWMAFWNSWSEDCAHKQSHSLAKQS